MVHKWRKCEKYNIILMFIVTVNRGGSGNKIRGYYTKISLYIYDKNALLINIRT